MNNYLNYYKRKKPMNKLNLKELTKLWVVTPSNRRIPETLLSGNPTADDIFEDTSTSTHQKEDCQ